MKFEFNFNREWFTYNYDAQDALANIKDKEVINQLLEDKEMSKCLVRENKHFTEDEMDEFFKQERLQISLVQNEKCPADLIRRYWQENKNPAPQVIIGNKNTTGNVLKEVFEKYPNQLDVLSHPNCPIEIIEDQKLENPGLLFKNPNLPDNIKSQIEFHEMNNPVSEISIEIAKSTNNPELQKKYYNEDPLKMLTVDIRKVMFRHNKNLCDEIINEQLNDPEKNSENLKKILNRNEPTKEQLKKIFELSGKDGNPAFKQHDEVIDKALKFSYKLDQKDFNRTARVLAVNDYDKYIDLIMHSKNEQIFEKVGESILKRLLKDPEQTFEYNSIRPLKNIENPELLAELIDKAFWKCSKVLSANKNLNEEHQQQIIQKINEKIKHSVDDELNSPVNILLDNPAIGNKLISLIAPFVNSEEEENDLAKHPNISYKAINYLMNENECGATKLLMYGNSEYQRKMDIIENLTVDKLKKIGSENINEILPLLKTETKLNLIKENPEMMKDIPYKDAVKIMAAFKQEKSISV